MSDENPWVDLKEAIRLVHRSRRTILRWAAEGYVRDFKPGRVRYFHSGDLLRKERATQGRGLR